MKRREFVTLLGSAAARTRSTAAARDRAWLAPRRAVQVAFEHVLGVDFVTPGVTLAGRAFQKLPLHRHFFVIDR